MTKKKILIMGSTGSIGASTLKVINSFLDNFEVTGLSTAGNIELLLEFARKYKPQAVAVKDEAKAREFKKRYNCPEKIRIFSGNDGLLELVKEADFDILVAAVSGGAGLLPVLHAVKKGKIVALANKEVLVLAGDIVMSEAKKSGAVIIPVDSEHSAILQCLKNEEKEKVRRIILTASGGPFLKLNKKDFEKITVEEALDHPTWEMGEKVTVDSATLMNKGFEVIEAHHLFSMPVDRIEVIIHPQSVVHSMVEYVDGSIIAQLGITDMRIPIQYALSYPERLNNNLPRLDLCRLKGLEFMKPDLNKFECLGFAYDACKESGVMPAILCGSSEAAVEMFLAGKIKFTGIIKMIKKAMGAAKKIKNPGIEDILRAEETAKQLVYKEAENG